MQPSADVEFTVIIPAYNEAEVIAQQLDALIEQTWDGSWDVLVVDNRSTDGTAEIVHEYQRRDPRFRVVTANERQGISYARNAGIEASRGRLFREMLVFWR